MGPWYDLPALSEPRRAVGDLSSTTEWQCSLHPLAPVSPLASQSS